MKERLALLIDWWSGRTAREQWLLGLLGLIVVAMIYGFGLAAPLRGAARAAEARHARAVADLSVVRALSGEIAALRSAAGVRPGGATLAQTVVRTATEAGVVLSRQEPSPDGGLSVWIEAVEPSRAFGWIARLNREQAINVASLEAQKAPGGGGLQLRVTFVGAGG